MLASGLKYNYFFLEKIHVGYSFCRHFGSGSDPSGKKIRSESDQNTQTRNTNMAWHMKGAKQYDLFLFIQHVSFLSCKLA